MQQGKRTDPYLTFNFQIEVEKLVVGGFTEVSGLQIEIALQNYREGGLNEYIHRLPGPASYPSNLVLKHGLTDGEVLWNWYQNVIKGNIERKNGSILLLSRENEEKWRWNFVEAYPVKWIGPELRAGTAEVAVETLELVHHGLTKAS